MTAIALFAAPSARRRAPYENWRPPIIGVSVLAPVGNSDLVLPRFQDGTFALPTGAVEKGQSPEDAGRAVLTGLADELPVQRRVVVDEVQMRRRQVITYVVITEPLTSREACALVYRDPRADLLVLPKRHALSSLARKGKLRAFLGLQAAEIGAMLHLRDGQISRVEDVQPQDVPPNR
ncbi:hypothetical protein ACFYO9_29260 [Streptomyces sp. NPDC005863]|uniref:hypothetical protein n=1 Tax=unclassified Streptomyces TaxID=2593676 RepID=UPI0033FFB4F8